MRCSAREEADKCAADDVAHQDEGELWELIAVDEARNAGEQLELVAHDGEQAECKENSTCQIVEGEIDITCETDGNTGSNGEAKKINCFGHHEMFEMLGYFLVLPMFETAAKIRIFFEIVMYLDRLFRRTQLCLGRYA